MIEGHSHRRRIRPRGIVAGLIERLRGRSQMLVRAGDDRPMLLVSFPRGSEETAREIETAYAHTFRRLSAPTRAIYEPVLAAAPALVVVLLRALNPCECLGHYHPRGAESRLARRLGADLHEPIGEIDLAFEGIRRWQPHPLSSLAAGDLGHRLAGIHFQAASLAVLLHELEHLVFPGRAEQAVRIRSNDFYEAAMRELVAEESGGAYGMASSRRPPRA